MSATERDFANYYLEDDVRELAHGLLPEMAEVFEVDLTEMDGDEGPSSEPLGKLVGAIGAKKTLRENEKGAKAWLSQQTGSEEAALNQAADWLERSSIQQALNRSLWTPHITPESDTPVIITGAVANWQDRTAALVAKMSPRQVFLASGTRNMNTPTEMANPNVLSYEYTNGVLPAEHGYAFTFVKPILEEAGHVVQDIQYVTESGDQIADGFVMRHPELLEGQIIFARVANAGIQLAVQFRNAARKVQPDFDSDPASPQVFVLTDRFPIARTPQQAANAPEFQNPFTGIRQVALTGKLLVEAAAN